MSAYSPYHILQHPLNKSPLPDDVSPLMLLYPGRPMTIYDNSSRSNIPSYRPELAKEAYNTKQHEIRDYADFLNSITLRQGGGDKNKIIPPIPVEPEATIEDPELRFATLSNLPNPKSLKEPPPIMGGDMPSFPYGIPTSIDYTVPGEGFPSGIERFEFDRTSNKDEGLLTVSLCSIAVVIFVLIVLVLTYRP
jgi:hypothetical protein